MLQSLGLSFEGEIHHGPDDVANLSRITETLIADGWRPSARACKWIEMAEEEIVCDVISRPDIL
jgi:inhibitor of KinA sporulation pathway (predicted exonuclease)